jgi:hypothetical protein
VLVDPQAGHWPQRLFQHRVRRGSERLMRDWPGDPGVAGRLGRCDAPVPHLGRGLLPQPPRDPAPRQDLRHRLRERLARAVLLRALPAALDPAHVYLLGAVAHVARAGHHVLVHPFRDRPASRAGRRAAGHHPHRDQPALFFGIDYPPARHAEQNRRRILGRRGSPAILDWHKSGSWDPRSAIRRNNTPRNATERLQSADQQHQTPAPSICITCSSQL